MDTNKKPAEGRGAAGGLERGEESNLKNDDTRTDRQTKAGPPLSDIRKALTGPLAALATRRQFVLYKLAEREGQAGKMDKLPVDHRAGRVVNAHDRNIWLSEDEALQAAERLGGGHGVGFVFTPEDPFWFLDIDNCLVDGPAWSATATDLMHRLSGAAVEVSQSGTGLHIVGTGQAPAHGCRRDDLGLEFYTEGRFVALTGTRAVGNAGADLSVALPALVSDYFPPGPERQSAASVEWTAGPDPEWAGPTDDDELIRRMVGSSPAKDQFGGRCPPLALLNADPDRLGQHYPDHNAGRAYDESAADAALASHLAFWTGRDCERIERMMRDSALARDKWDRHRTYLRRTILNAVANCQNVYTAGRGHNGGETEKERPPLTDVGNAERVVRQYGDSLRYVPEWGWLVWDGRRWRRDELQARELILRAARQINAEAAQAVERREQDEITKWAKQSQNAARIQAAMWCAQPALAAAPGNFDNEPMLLPVANGTVDLRMGELREHSREDYATKLALVKYDKNAECPEWIRFLARVLPDAEVRAFVQRLVGYSLTGLTTEQILMFLYGNGRNGKSVFLESVAKLLGDYAQPTRIETLSITRGGGISNDVAALAGARLVTVSETPEGSRLNESLVKDLTGGDTITARFLHREFFQFTPELKLWIRGNHKPQIRGTDDGIWRRVLLVPFTVQIPPEDVDPDLPRKLHDEMPGILAWAVRGCLEWQRDGLNPPDSVTDAVREYRDEMDILGEFIAQRCVTEPGRESTSSALYAAYRVWCNEQGHHPVGATRFGTSLGERGFHRVKRSSICWLGIAPMNTGWPE